MKDMKIKIRLILAFGVTIALALLMVVVVQISSMITSNNYQSILNRDVSTAQAVLTARVNINTAARYLRDMAISGYSSEEENKINSTLSDLDKALDSVEKTYPMDDGMAAAYRSEVNNWKAVVPQIIAQLKAGNDEAAARMLREECTPALNSLGTAGLNLTNALNAHTDTAVDEDEQLSNVLLVVVVALVVISLIFILIMVTQLIRAITIPLNETVRALEGMSRGDFSHKIDYTSHNELGQMTESLRKSRDVLEGVINDVSHVTSEMADGNFDVSLTAEFPGELARIQVSMHELVQQLNSTLTNISQSADQVAAGSEQVSNSAQALAQGATEQASAVEELSATISEIAASARRNSEAARNSREQSLLAGAQVDVCAGFMKEMVSAMDNISGSSQEIAKIIATIENIAFQTNILALNAAVEAARAGTAGKGFAVVADEVRNLASKSDQAAKATKELIEGSVNAVKHGSEIVGGVSEALQKTIELAGAAVGGMGEIASAVDAEAQSIAQVTEGIDQISAVVQTNSATSEESAAASEELSSQANLMHHLLSNFRLSQRVIPSDLGRGNESRRHTPRSAAMSSAGVSVLSEPKVEERYSAEPGYSPFDKY